MKNLLGGGFTYAPKYKKQPSKVYKHKNKNIRYYYDEKGNIRKERLWKKN